MKPIPAIYQRGLPVILVAAIASPSPPSEGGECLGEVGALNPQPSTLNDPDPCAILRLKVIDKAMGSGHFLVESCRFLGDALYDTARQCDDEAAKAEKRCEAYRNSSHKDKAAAEETRATALRQRVLDLPDPDDELLRYLPSRSPEGQASGFSEKKAKAICKRMVAVHCLYGVDKNPLAVELAKLALWIECHAEGLPLTFLDHRLVVGDSLTGPFFEHLLKYPGSQQPLDDLFTQGLTAKLTTALADALQHVRALEATVGVTVADIEAKQAAKTRLDRALAPFKILAAAWSGGVMLGKEGCDDTAYAALASWAISDFKSEMPDSPVLLRMIAKGLGLAPETDWGALKSQIADPKSAAIPALPFDLAFPEVFYPDANPVNRLGFDADLGNPPWDRIEVPEEEFWANYDLEVLSVDDKEAGQPIIRTIAKLRPESECEWTRLLAEMESQFRLHEALYHCQVAIVNGKSTTGRPDLYRLFAERAAQVLRAGGLIGCVFPGAIHGNEGATGIRRLFLEQMSLRCCYSFENRRKLFEIDSRFKFAVIVAAKGEVTSQFGCGFYLHDDEWLFAANRQPPALSYSLDFVRRTGGQFLSFSECRKQSDADLLSVLYAGGVTPLGEVLIASSVEIAFGVELHRNQEFNQPLQPVRFADELGRTTTTLAPDIIPVVEGKAFHQFTDRGEYPVEVAAPLAVVMAKSKWNPSVAFYRLAYREVAASTNVRTLICAILPAGVICNHTAGIETTPHMRPTAFALALCALLNSFFADWQVRQKAQTHVSAFIFRSTRLPSTAGPIGVFLSHSALRLSCNHAGFSPLWREQLGEAWREAWTAFTWPVLSGDDLSAVAGTAKADARWAVRAAIDAVVAHAYGLTRDQYAHVLSTFSHSSYKDAPRRCLAAFDELQSLGLEAFTKKHDPYWDIPLNENLPQPVIDLPIPATAPDEAPRPRTGELFDFQTTAAPLGSGVLFTEQPVPPGALRKGRSRRTP